MRGINIGAVLVVCLTLFLVVFAVNKMGVTFGAQCSSAGFQGPEYFKCIEWLSEGKSWEDWE